MKNNDRYLKIMIMPVYIFLIYIVLSVLLNNFDNIDVTGLGQTFLYINMGISTILGIICLKYSLKVPESGVSFKFNKIMAIVLVVYSIICLSMGIYLRTVEEKMAKEYYKSFGFKELDFFEMNNVDYSKMINKLIEEETYSNKRLDTINNEINQEPNSVYRYVRVFTTGMDLSMGSNRFIFGNAIYYIAYTTITALSLYLAWFFIHTI